MLGRLNTNTNFPLFTVLVFELVLLLNLCFGCNTTFIDCATFIHTVKDVCVLNRESALVEHIKVWNELNIELGQCFAGFPRTTPI